MMRGRPLLALGILLLGLQSLPGEARTQPWARDPATGCTFQPPVSVADGPVFWTGPCPGDRASGLGMLRRRDGETPGAAFFGEIRDGVPVIGVVQVEGGYEVGRYRDGLLTSARLRSLEFQERLDAFRTAARAARAVAARFRDGGNAGSAAHYEGVARVLDEQEE